jgi:hypothetical protein
VHGVAVAVEDPQIEAAGLGQARQVRHVTPAIRGPVLGDHQHPRRRARLRGQPLDRRHLFVAEPRLRVALAQEPAPVHARAHEAESPDVEAFAIQVLGGADELHVLVERHPLREPFGRHDGSRP